MNALLDASLQSIQSSHANSAYTCCKLCAQTDLQADSVIHLMQTMCLTRSAGWQCEYSQMTLLAPVTDCTTWSVMWVGITKLETLQVTDKDIDTDSDQPDGLGTQRLNRGKGNSGFVAHHRRKLLTASPLHRPRWQNR